MEGGIKAQGQVFKGLTETFLNLLGKTRETRGGW